MPERRRVLLLGADGYLGRHVARVLSSARDGVDVLQAAGRRHPGGCHRPPAPGTWVELDVVSDPEPVVRRVMECLRPDVVVNCVGATGGTSAEMQAVNVLAPAKLVKALKSGGSAHLVHLGSAAEYGLPGPSVSLAETADAAPASEYGATKLAATELVLEAAAGGRLSASVLRIFNPIGAGAPPSTLAGRTVAVLRDALAARARTVELGPLDAWRDFIAASDVAEAVVAAALHSSPCELPNVLNIGRGIAVPSRFIVHQLARVASYAGEIVERSQPSPRSALVSWQEADITAARRALDWAPNRPLVEALVETWSGAPDSAARRAVGFRPAARSLPSRRWSGCATSSAGLASSGSP